MDGYGGTDSDRDQTGQVQDLLGGVGALAELENAGTEPLEGEGVSQQDRLRDRSPDIHTRDTHHK
jgi:hypothetical protein